MTILSALSALFSSNSASRSDDYIEQPPYSGSLFYEIIEMPSGPGVDQLKKIMAYLPPLDLKKGPWLAGGACRRILQSENLEGGDIDIFFSSRNSRKEFEEALSRFEILHKSNMATSYKVDNLIVQTIKRELYLTLEDVFRDFDFSACQIASDGKWLAGTPQAIRDIKTRTLRFAPQGKVSKGTVITRMAKYLNHGFIPEPGLFKIMIEAGIDYDTPYHFGHEVSVNEQGVYDHGLDVEDSLLTEEMNSQILRQIKLDFEEKFGV